jgi:GNAT superfamily N-acetyltransferase
MTQHKITREDHPTHDDLHVLRQGLIAHAKQKKDLKPTEDFALFIRDENQNIIGGANGYTFYGCVYVDQLWIDEKLRSQGYGAKLMHAAEQLGLERDCTFAAVNTMDWEGLEFYQKLGYHVEFERHGFTKNSIFYFLRKNLIK